MQPSNCYGCVNGIMLQHAYINTHTTNHKLTKNNKLNNHYFVQKQLYSKQNDTTHDSIQTLNIDDFKDMKTYGYSNNYSNSLFFF